MTAPDRDTLRAWIVDARERSLALIADLSDEQCMVPRMPIVTPYVWELAHAVWFQEKWVLRHAHGRPPIHENGDAMYDSATIPHPKRWDLPQLSRAEVVDYCRRALDDVLATLDAREPDERESYFLQLSVYHEDMHAEAFTYMRQTLGQPAPPFCGDATGDVAATDTSDVPVPGGTYRLGATRNTPYVFDNEKWAHEVTIEPFRISRRAVTQGPFAEFVDDGGYATRDLWSEDGWAWREETGAVHPVYWRRADGGWEWREFDRWSPLAPEKPIVHVTWFEADAFCRWAGRRLPAESEWELAASGPDKPRFPWGLDASIDGRANMEWHAGGTVPAGAHAAGDSPYGCRQMIGNLWEWTSTTFEPYPGFVPDPYKEYSQPFFDGSRRVLRGGSWASTARMLRNTWRNYFERHRNDVICGFRTCARA